MYVYIRTDGNHLFTVGFYKPDGRWEPDSDWPTSEEAASRVHYLNGGHGYRVVGTTDKVTVVIDLVAELKKELEKGRR